MSLARITVDVLPTDLLVAVFAYLPLRPRLLVIGRVCRRWRVAVTLSVTAIRYPSRYAGPLERFPNLTEVWIDSPAGPPAAWTAERCNRIRALTVRQHAPTSRCCFSSLTSLVLSFSWVGPATNAFLHLVPPNIASLTHVSVLMSTSCNLVAAMPAGMSSLSSLELRFVNVSRIAGPLTRLSLNSLLSQRTLMATPPQEYSRLRSLRLAPFVPEPHSVGWLAALPSLTALDVEFHSCADVASCTSFLRRFAPVLVSLFLYHSPVELAEVLMACTRVTRLQFMRQDDALRAALSLPLQYVRLSLRNTLLHTPTHACLTSLTALETDHYAASVLPQWRMPRLRALTITKLTLEGVAKLLRSLPTLQTLAVGSIQPITTPDMAGVVAAVKEADARGMEVIDLGVQRDGDGDWLASLRDGLQWVALRWTLPEPDS